MCAPVYIMHVCVHLPLCACVYVFLCISYMFVCIYLHVYVILCICMRLCAQTYVCMHVCVKVSICESINNQESGVRGTVLRKSLELICEYLTIQMCMKPCVYDCVLLGSAGRWIPI